MAQLRVVMKRFIADGKIREPGEVVDVSKWKNAASMERSRYLGPVPDEPKARKRAEPGGVS